MNDRNPHQNQPVVLAGASKEEASIAVICLHGRGGSSHDILQLAESFELPRTLLVAPQAFENTWYPYRFTEAREKNQPHLSSALGFVEETIHSLADAGFRESHIFLLGFSQGACLALQYLAEYSRILGGTFALSGGLIGSDEEVDSYSGNLDGTYIFIGCGDADSHISLERVEHSSAVFRGLGAQVEKRIYQNMGHAINEDEVKRIKNYLVDAT